MTNLIQSILFNSILDAPTVNLTEFELSHLESDYVLESEAIQVEAYDLARELVEGEAYDLAVYEGSV